MLESLRQWFEESLSKLSRKSDTTAAIRYALSRWEALVRYGDDGRIEIDNNAAERTLRAVALGRKNYLFAGSDAGGERAAESAKMVKFDYPDRPVAFMSYSWDNKEHEGWVRALATRLTEEGGVNVILDKWHLRFGMDKTFLMEESVENSNFVLVICTPQYAKKANKRSGGVGYEAMIITGELADDIKTTKFIPVLREGEWDRKSMPRWLKTKTGADLRGNPYSDEQYNLLVRELHGEYPKPPAPGPKPHFSLIAHAPASSAAPAPAVQPAPKTQTAPVQSAPVYAWYETKGPDAKRFKVFIRPTDSSNTRYVMETSDGEKSPEGSVAETARDFILLHMDLIGKDYVRMQWQNASGHKEFDLPA